MIKFPRQQFSITPNLKTFNALPTGNTISYKASCSRLFLLLILLYGYKSQAQISFENGYFIENSGNKTECLIRNLDWMKNPIDFHYKISEDSEVRTENVNSVREFGITGQSKYIVATVNIDHSSNDVNELGMAREPNFSKEKLFLKVLVEGKANLYLIEDNFRRNYFYKTKAMEIEPLVYWRFITPENTIAENNRYKQQLWTELSHPNIEQRELSRLDYRKEDLTDFFLKFNSYFDGKTLDYEKNKNKGLINLTLRPGVRSSSLTFNSGVSSLSSVEYGQKQSFRFGAEIETILPFNKNKWSFFVEPTYQYYTTEKELRPEVSAVVDYKAIEITMGARHYMYLSDTSKLFVNTGFVLAISGSSKIQYNNGFQLDLENSRTIGFGIGYKYKDTYSLEFNYHLSRDMLNLQETEAIYNSFSFIFGYTLF